MLKVFQFDLRCPFQFAVIMYIMLLTLLYSLCVLYHTIMYWMPTNTTVTATFDMKISVNILYYKTVFHDKSSTTISIRPIQEIRSYFVTSCPPCI